MTAPLVFITGASSGIGQALAARYAAGRLAAGPGGAARGPTEAWAAGQGWMPSAGASTAPTWREVDSIVAAGQACMAARAARRGDRQRRHQRGHGHRRARDLDVMRAPSPPTTRPGRHLPPLRRADAPARQRHAGGHRQRGGIRGLPGHGAYCASKAGVVAYCESLRGELRGSGVRVVTLLPGYIDTPLTAATATRCPS
jgi:NAD(P)-dependent dehydrogenase (short-subunit alcohol dehydrogenase family)